MPYISEPHSNRKALVKDYELKHLQRCGMLTWCDDPSCLAKLGAEEGATVPHPANCNMDMLHDTLKMLRNKGVWVKGLAYLPLELVDKLVDAGLAKWVENHTYRLDASFHEDYSRERMHRMIGKLLTLVAGIEESEKLEPQPAEEQFPPKEDQEIKMVASVQRIICSNGAVLRGHRE